MTSAHAELDRLARAVAEGKVPTRDALELAYAIGCEVERLDAKQRACSEYDRARTAREAAFRRHVTIGDWSK